MADKKSNNTTDDEYGKPWYHYGHAWLVFGGPAAVVVASLITVYIAVMERDPMVDENYYQNGININKTLAAEADAKNAIEARNALAPAVKARNHAATGVNDN
jgi:hypothetical protein